ncbi:MAG: hypothetical protein AAB176_01550, partial [Pseudomonadota bacterium]
GGTASPALTPADLAKIGLADVTDNNLAAVLAAIAAKNNDGSQTDSLAELQALVTGLNTAATDLGAFAEANTTGLANATGTVPVLVDYTDAGVTGVTADNLAAINDALASAPITGEQANSPAELQAIVDAYKAILAEANDTADSAGDGTVDATPTVDPTAAQYAAIGAVIGTTATDPENLALLNDIVGAQQTTGVDTIAEINELARIANAIQTIAAGGTASPALTVDDLTKMGLATTSVTPANLPAVLAAIAAKNNDGSQTDSLVELQAIVDSVDTAPPTITTVAFGSTTGATGGWLNEGDTVSFTVTFNENVTVTGTPQLQLNIGGTMVPATYVSGTGTTALTFSYTIQASQNDVDGLSIEPNSLGFNGGSIQDSTGNLAILTHAGVTATNPLDYRVDTTAPATTAVATGLADDVGLLQGNVASGTTTDDTHLTVTGTLGGAIAGASLVSGESLRIYDGSTYLGDATVTVNNGGQSIWSFVDTRTLTEIQTVSYTARVTDAALNQAAAGTAYTATVDTTAPTTTAAVTGLVDNVGALQGNVATGTTTDDTSLIVTGTLGGATAGASLAAGESVRIYDGTTFLGNATVTTVSSGQSTWSFTDTRTLVNTQTVSYNVRVADAALNPNTASTAYTATVDTTAPAFSAAVTGLADNVGAVTGNVATGTTTDDTSLTVTGTLGGATAGASLAAGESVRIYDGATFLGNATVTVVSGGQSTWSFTDTRTLTDTQALSYTVQVADAALNLTTVGTAYTATVDTTAPAQPAAPTSYADNAGALTSATSTAATTDDTTPGINVGTGLITPKLYVDGVLVAATYNATTGTLTPDVAITANGDHVFTYTVSDAAGNESQLSAGLTINIDTTAPATSAAVTGLADNAGAITGNVATGTTTDDTSLTVTGTLGGATAGASLAAGESVRIYDGATFLGNATVTVVSGGQSTWSFTDTRTLTDTQALSYNVRVADAALNPNTASTAYTATVDTTAPAFSAAVTGLADNVGAVTGNVATGTTTDDTSLTVTGTLGGATAGASLAAGESVRIYDGATFLGNATVTVVSGGQSTWSFTDTRTLTDTQALSY